MYRSVQKGFRVRARSGVQVMLVGAVCRDLR